MEMRFQFGFEHEFHHSLGNTIRDSRNPERALTTAFLWNQNFLHGRRKVASRAHPIPNPVQVIPEVSLKQRDRFLIHASGTCISAHEPPGTPYQPFRNIKRFAVLVRSSPCGLALDAGPITRPLRSGSITEPSSLLRVDPSLMPRLGTLGLVFVHLAFSLRIDA